MKYRKIFTNLPEYGYVIDIPYQLNYKNQQIRDWLKNYDDIVYFPPTTSPTGVPRNGALYCGDEQFVLLFLLKWSDQ